MTHFGTKERAWLVAAAALLAGHETEGGGQLQGFAQLEVARLRRLCQPAAAQLLHSKTKKQKKKKRTFNYTVNANASA